MSGVTIVGVNITDARRLSTTFGIVLLAYGGWLLSRSARRTRGFAAWTVIAGGAAMTTIRGGLPGSLWVQIAAPALIILLGYAMKDWAVIHERQLLGPLFFISAFGIWSTVPDTDSARVLLGTSIPFGLATLGRSGLGLTLPGAFSVAAILVWVVATGGEGRHGSIVGGWACVGLLFLLPIVVKGKQRQLPSSLVLMSHMGMVLIASRLFGLWESAMSALLGVIPTVVITYVLLRTPGFRWPWGADENSLV